MIRRFALLALACSSAVAIAALAEPPAAGSGVGVLTVVPVGLEENQGSVMISLVNSEAAFGDDEKPFRSAIVPVEDKRARGVFEEVPHGDYAVKVFHDENDNQKLDTNFVGMPKEMFGFSNNALGRFGPPSYDQARFRFDAEAATLEIEMR
jgi:uncharacterized protein (DUF2141 family)